MKCGADPFRGGGEAGAYYLYLACLFLIQRKSGSVFIPEKKWSKMVSSKKMSQGEVVGFPRKAKTIHNENGRDMPAHEACA